LLRYLSPQLIEQLTELRSTIVKEACIAVSLLAQKMGSKFEAFALQYLQALIKMVIVKTAIISDAAHVTIKDMLMCVQTKNLLSMFLNGSLDPKNEQLRKRCCEYILIILNRAIQEPGMILTTAVPALEKSITHLLVDGGSDVRLTSRYCFWAYSELAEDAAIKMLYTFTPTTQRNLFTITDSIPPAQQEIAEKIKQSLFEEEESQKHVGDSNDLDFDINDFKKDDSSNSNSNSSSNINRSKTPTSSGRMSGLKAPRPSLGGTTTTSSSSTSASTTKSTTASATSNTTQIKRAGSSLGMKSTSIPEPERTIKKPLDSASIIRSKSSLGTIRKPVSAAATTAAISSALSSTLTKTTSTSPNLSSTQSGRYSSIGTRAVISPSSSMITSPTLSKQSSSSNLTRSLPPSSKSPISSSLTKSTSPTTSSTNLPTLTSNKSVSTPTTPTGSKITPPSATSRRTSLAPSSSSSTGTTPISSPSTLTKKLTTTTTTTTSSPLSSTLTKKSTTSTTTTTTTSSPSLSKSKSLPSATLSESTKKRLSSELKQQQQPTTTQDDTDINILTEKTKESLNLDSFERSLNQNNNNNLAFREISESLAGSIRDAKKGLSLYDELESNELTLDDLDTKSNGKSNNNNSNNNHNNISGGFQFSLDTIKRSKSIEEEEFKWIEEESGLDDDLLIENDPLDFNDNQELDDDDILNDNNNNDDDENVILDQESNSNHVNDQEYDEFY